MHHHHHLQGYNYPITTIYNPREVLTTMTTTTTTTTRSLYLPRLPQSTTTLTCGVSHSVSPQAVHPGAHPPPAHLIEADGAKLGQAEHQGKAPSSAKRYSARLSRKKCRNSGKAYISTTGKTVEAKKYIEKNCDCRHNCLSRLGTLGDREAAFRRFWGIGDFQKQNIYLAQSVVLMPSKRRKNTLMHLDPPKDERRLKTVKRLYYVKIKEGQTPVRVCKSQFLRLHGVSNGRLDRVLQALQCAQPGALQDRRGHHIPSNKTPSEDVELALQHILDVRWQGDGAGPLEGPVTQSQCMPVKRMHELYQKWCETQGKTPVSLWVYRQVWKASRTTQEIRKGCDAAVEETQEVQEEEKVVVSLLRGERGNAEEAVSTNTSTTTTTATISFTSTTTMANTSVSLSLTSTVSLNSNYVTAADVKTGTTVNSLCSVVSSALPSQLSVSLTTSTAAIPPSITTTTIAPTSTNITATATTATEAPKLKRMKRRRRLKEADWGSAYMSRAERKARRNKGEAYITSSGKMQSRKVYQDRPCGCRQRCIPALGTLQDRRQVFESFWGLANFTQQNAYIVRMVELAPLGQRRGSASPVRTCSRVYSVRLKVGGEMHRVCKVAFLCLHGISNGRLDRVLQAVAGQSPCDLKDRRGCHAPKNKTREEDARHALSHMSSISPIDSSQPSKHSQPILSLSVEKMYRMYLEQCVTEDRKPVGSFVYRRILKERFGGMKQHV